MIEAAKTLFPRCTIRCCNFHLGQSFKRRIEERFAKEYRDKDNALGKYLRLSFGFAGMDPDMVPEAFSEYKAAAPAALTDYIDYLETTYMKVNSTYPPCLWSGVYTTQLPTTTNGCEAFHAAYSRLFASDSHHPNIHIFLEKLFIEHTWKTIMFTTSVYVPKPRHKNADQLESLKRNELSVMDYLKSVCSKMLPPN